jgi:RHS repeat-associated protein
MKTFKKQSKKKSKKYSYAIIVLILISIFSVLPSFAGQKVYFYHTDAAGTPVAMTDASGTVIWRADYKPFGEEQSITLSPENNVKFVGKEKDKETGLYYFGARYMDAGIGRFTSPDPVGIREADLLDPQKLNRYNYSLNNPYRYIDLDGREVTIIIQRDKYTNKSVSGTIKVTSDVTTSTFKGYTLENAHAGDNHDKPPIPPGTYDAKVRADHDPDRVELEGVDNYENIQIHTGNTAKDVKGCFAVGNTCSKNFVGGSQKAMTKINKIIEKDGTGKIKVTVIGPSKQEIKKPQN